MLNLVSLTTALKMHQVFGKFDTEYACNALGTTYTDSNSDSIYIPSFKEAIEIFKTAGWNISVYKDQVTIYEHSYQIVANNEKKTYTQVTSYAIHRALESVFDTILDTLITQKLNNNQNDSKGD